MNVERELRWLKGYAVVSSVFLLVITLGAFKQGQSAAPNGRFAVLDVERLNIVEPSGHPRVVISNKPRSPTPMRKGKPFIFSEGTRPGFIFYDDEGSEAGGLIFAGERKPDGTYNAFGHFSFDQFNQNQVLFLRYADNNGSRDVGMTVADRHSVDFYQWWWKRDSLRKKPQTPEIVAQIAQMERGEANDPNNPRYAERVYVGRDRQRNAMVKLADRWGKVRLRMLVDSLGNPRIEFLDSLGAVTKTIGQE